MTPAEREAYRAANRTELRAPTPWKMVFVQVLAVLLLLGFVSNVVMLVLRISGWN